MNVLITFLFLFTTIAMEASAEQTFPRSNWRDQLNPQADRYAEPGGKISVLAGQYPASFNYYLDNTSTSAGIFNLMYESLITTDGLTLESIPGIADRWTISDDKKTFTFHIDSKATWSDGKRITADDIIWTYHAVMKPEHLTGPHKVSLERLDPPEKIDEETVRFHAKEVHWGNLLYAGGFHIFPKHTLENLDFNKINFEFPVVSGPYRLGEVRESSSVRMEKRTDYWAINKPSNQNTLNFETIEFRFYPERDNAFDAFRKGEFDVFAVYAAHRWINQTQGEKFDKNWIVKQAVYNHAPQGFQGWAMNMRRELFKDRRVRLALAHLLNRDKMNETHMYNQYKMHRSYYEDLYDKDHPCPNPLIPFDKEKARTLLKNAGWSANPNTGILEKDETPLKITFLTRSATSDKFLDVYREDLRDVGIELIIDRKDWAAWTKDMNEFNYDMTWAAWGAGLRKDPEGMWHSRESNRLGSNNITGFKNKQIDILIEKQRGEFDLHKRHEIVREIDQILSKEVPYILLWYIDYARLLYWNKFGTPGHVLTKHGSESTALALWWIDPDAELDLESALESGNALSPHPTSVIFDDVFRISR